MSERSNPLTTFIIVGLLLLLVYAGVFVVCYEKILIRTSHSPMMAPLWVHERWLWEYPGCMNVLDILYQPVFALLNGQVFGV